MVDPPDGSPAAPKREGQRRAVVPQSAALIVGGLTGLLALLGMVRLTAGAFSAGMSSFAWVVVLTAMLPWVLYVATRARHGRLTRRALTAILALLAVGFVAVWFGVLGHVVALACSLAAFVVVWISDWPDRRPRGEDRFVRMEELQREDDR